MGIVRFFFAAMLCIANMIFYGLKVNIATAIIGMVKKNSGGVNETLVCPELEPSDSSSVDLEGPYDWTSTQQGLVVSMYFAGYLIGMFPSGYFADRFNTKWVLLICIFCNAIFTMLVPIAAQSIEILLTLRFLNGLMSAANLPIVNVLVGKWVVYEEKSFIVGMIYAGTSLGTVFSILSSGMIMSNWGWENVFYIHGVLPLIWCLFFWFFFADTPEAQKFISEEERALLVNSYGHRTPVSGKVKIPWKAIWTSGPFWALMVTNTLGNFIWYFLLTQMPLYMSKILRFDVKSNSVITCLPYLFNALVNTAIGKSLDFGRRRGWWSQTVARKIAVAISCIPAIICLLVIAYIGCRRLESTILLCLGIIFSGAIFVGHLTNQNDLAPNYAGILMGITNTPGTISAFLVPALVGVLVRGGHTFENWRYVFWLNIIAQALAFFTFMLFGSAKIQNWNYPDGIPPAATVN